jgi:hypothetical protein
MLSILFIYFIGKAFYTLAEEHNKHNWLFGILGVVSYYAGAFLGGILIGVIYVIQNPDGVMEELDDRLLSLLTIPIGLLSCWLFYRILKSQWGKQASRASEIEVLDADLLNNNPNL